MNTSPQNEIYIANNAAEKEKHYKNNKNPTSEDVCDLCYEVEDVHILGLVAVDLVAEDGGQILQVVILAKPASKS